MSPTPFIVLYDDAGVVTTPFRKLPEGIESTSLMFSILRLSEEEKNHRRQPTNFAIKWMLLAVEVAFILVTVVLRSLEKLTFQLCREAAESNTILSSLRGSYILTDKNYRILRLNERTSSIFPLAKRGANLLEVIKKTTAEISGEDLKHLIDVVTGIRSEDVQVKLSGKYYYAANIDIPADKELPLPSCFCCASEVSRQLV